jgi:glycosyltransferase involved in cell wall biosynthesis
LLPTTLRSLLLQDYAGSFNVFLVDDRSTDDTANFAEGVAHAVGKPQQLHIITGESLPSGWSGKLWAVEQGINPHFSQAEKGRLNSPTSEVISNE